MLYDFAKGPIVSDDPYDVCILGAGAAGITLAVRLGRAGKRVALCEGGGLDYEDESQEIYAGSTFGDPYFDLDIARLRYFWRVNQSLGRLLSVLRGHRFQSWPHGGRFSLAYHLR